MIRTLSVVALVSIGATIAYAQGTGGAAALAERKTIMKAQNDGAKQMSAMAKGEAPFDLAKVQAWLKATADGTGKAKSLFPDDSKTGETRATPAVWANRADFNAKADDMVAKAKAAAAAIKDEASFKAELPGVLKTCDACHENNRAPPVRK